MVPGDMYKWFGVIFVTKSKFHDAGGPDTVVSPYICLRSRPVSPNVVR